MNAAGLPEGSVTITMRLKGKDGEFVFSEAIEDWMDAVSQIASLERVGWIFVSIEVHQP